MNVEGAEVERRLGRTVLPRFHAGCSFGSIGGAGHRRARRPLRRPASGALPRGGPSVHALAVLVDRADLPGGRAEHDDEDDAGPAARPGSSRAPSRSGAMVLAFTLAEGSANDWLALALVDGYDARHFVGVAGFALFVTAMTTGRLLGPILLDRFGRVPVLLASAVAAFVGLLTVIVSGEPARRGGHRRLGTGRRAGLPGRDERRRRRPRRAARRVSVVSTVGYGAFLTGPPLLGLRRQPGGDARLAVRRGGRHGAGGGPGAGGAEARARTRWLRRDEVPSAKAGDPAARLVRLGASRQALARLPRPPVAPYGEQR